MGAMVPDGLPVAAEIVVVVRANLGGGACVVKLGKEGDFGVPTRELAFGNGDAAGGDVPVCVWEAACEFHRGWCYRGGMSSPVVSVSLAVEITEFAQRFVRDRCAFLGADDDVI